MPALPSSLALTTIAPGASILSADHRTNYSAIQVAVNALIAALGVTGKGSLLAASASGVLGELTVGTNGQALVADSTQSLGVKWGSGGALTQLFDSTLGVSAANIDITGISGSYNHLLLLAQLRGDAAVNQTQCNVTFNGDTGANYQYQYFLASNAASGLSAGVAATAIFGGDITASLAPANYAGSLRMDVPNYAKTTFHKDLIVQTMSPYGAAAGNREALYGGGNWLSTAAITRMTLTPASGNWIAGSRVTLYGVA